MKIDEVQDPKNYETTFKSDKIPTPKRRSFIMAAIAKLAPDSAIGIQYRAILAADKETQAQVKRAMDHLEFGGE